MFKSLVGDEGLTRFDKTISDLNRVELLRYPDEVVDKGFKLNIRLGVPELSQKIDSENLPEYFLNISDLDDIVSSIFDICKVNPKAAFRNTPAEFMNTLPPKLRSW